MRDRWRRRRGRIYTWHLIAASRACAPVTTPALHIRRAALDMTTTTTDDDDNKRGDPSPPRYPNRTLPPSPPRSAYTPQQEPTTQQQRRLLRSECRQRVTGLLECALLVRHVARHLVGAEEDIAELRVTRGR